jgi:hypothetical protein
MYMRVSEKEQNYLKIAFFIRCLLKNLKPHNPQLRVRAINTTAICTGNRNEKSDLQRRKEKKRASGII